LLLSATAGAAEDLEKARAYFQAGVDAYDSGKYEVALREFQQSHALSHNPALYFNMAACEEKMTHYQAAALLLRQYLIEKPTADDKDKVEMRIKTLEERDADMKRPEPGEVKPVEKPAEVAQPPPQPPPPPPKKRVISWALLGVTAALAVGWIGAGSYAIVNHNSLHSGCGSTPMGCSAGDRSTQDTIALASDVLMGVTIAAAVVTVAMFVVEPKLGRKKSEKQASVKMTPAGLVF
jgi:hypothetical protein